MVNAKLLLLGEYSIFLFKKAIGISLSTWQSKAFFKEKKEDGIKIKSKIKSSKTKDIEKFLEKTFNLQGEISMSTEVPIGLGFGSSAVFSLSLIESLKNKLNLSEQDIYKYSKKIEEIIHFKSSGVDLLLASKKKAVYIVDILKNDAIETNLFDGFFIHIFAVKRNKEAFDSIKKVLNYKNLELKKLSFLVEEFCRSHFLNDERIYKNINLAHSILKDMSLSSKDLDLIRDFILKTKLAEACKISGAGCGGSFFAISKQKNDIIKKVKEFCQNKNINLLTAFTVKI